MLSKLIRPSLAPLMRTSAIFDSPPAELITQIASACAAAAIQNRRIDEKRNTRMEDGRWRKMLRFAFPPSSILHSPSSPQKCRRGGSNPYAFRHRLLRPARL